MATNRGLEMVLGAMYPTSMRHLQQLLMDAEKCAKSYGRTGLFGRDKFQPAFDEFISTVRRCVVSLAVDGQISDPDDTESGMEALNDAVLKLEDVYGNWTMSFQFWRVYFSQFKASLEDER